MKIKVFNRKRYTESLEKLKKRNAPKHVIEAYEYGFTEEVNQYYKVKRIRLLNNDPVSDGKDILETANQIEVGFIKEAVSKKDLDFLKVFFQMTNMNIFTGKKLPPDAAKLLKPEHIKDLGLKELYKKMR